MENLTKHQLILVGLLISFVTSIVTGIVTLSLVDQNYQGPTYTINRVIEHTIEKAIPSDGPAQIQKETIVVDLSDQAASAAEKGERGLVRISSIDSPAGSIGVMLTKDGYFAADATVTALKDAKVSFGSAKDLSFTLATTSAEYGFAVYKVDVPSGSDFSPLPSISVSKLKLAQSMVAVGGPQAPSVSLGSIRGKLSKGEGDAAVTYGLKTDIDSPDLGFGNTLVTLSGEFAGLYVFSLNRISGGSYVSSDTVKALLP